MPGPLPHLASAVDDSPVVDVPAPRGLYDLRRYPFGEFGTRLDASLVAEIVGALAAAVAALAPDGPLLAPEPGGNQWAVAVGYRTGRDVVVLRGGNAVGEASRIARRTAFYEGDLYVPPLPRDAPVVIVDDVVSSGGTLDPILSHLAAEGVAVAGVQAILARGSGFRAVEVRHGVPVRCLVVDEAPRRAAG
jgi:adenine/guanine phosphoribosyltransferase-like PRPP-binding protein